MAGRLSADDPLIADSNLSELGAGGEGSVFGLLNEPTLVYKRFLAPKPAASLTRWNDVVSNMAMLPPDGTARIRSRTTWPNRAVVDSQGRLVGVVMRRIPEEFFSLYGRKQRPKNVLMEWQYLISHRETLTNPLLEPGRLATIRGNVDVLRLAADAATTFRTLHDADVVVGDVSAKNLVWTYEPARGKRGAEALFIDCDSYRPDGGLGLAEPKESPHWEDPDLSSGEHPDARSDVYKFGLLVYRAMWGDREGRPPGRPSGSSQFGQPVAGDVCELVAESMAPRGDRPMMSDWETGLLAAEAAAPEAPKRPLSASAPAAEKERPVVQMRQDAGTSKRPSVKLNKSNPRRGRPTIDLN